MESAQLFLDLFTSVIGAAYFVYGKKSAKWMFLICGVILMFFGYFIESVWLTVLLFVVLTAAPFYFK